MKKSSFTLFQKLAVMAAPLMLLAAVNAPAVAATPSGATVQSDHAAKFYRPKDQRVHTRATSGVVVVNAASYLAGVCPGGIATIFGQGLSVVTDTEGASTSDPLPVQIADVTVQVNGIFAPLYYVAYTQGEDQISIQVPYETPVGLGAVVVDVYSSGTLVASVTTDSYTEDPGIFLYLENGINYAVAVHSDYSLITPEDPALPGEVIVVYTTGLGPLTVALQDGFGAPSDPLAYTTDPFTATVNSEDCLVDFSGLAPGFVGLYQLNLQLPSDLPAGPLNLQISTPYSNSGIALLPVG